MGLLTNANSLESFLRQKVLRLKRTMDCATPKPDFAVTKKTDSL